MTSADETPVKPQSETLYLLGGLNAKMDVVIGSQAAYENRLRAVEAVVAALPKRQPWTTVAAGFASIAALVLAIITVINLVTP